MSDQIANLLAKRFIARPDVKAIQYRDGSWSPHLVDPKDRDSERIPWSRDDLNSHIAGTQTFGHYLLNPDSQCKLFAFDIDLEENKPPESKTPFQGYWPSWAWHTSPDDDTSQIGEPATLMEFNPRVDWLNRSHPSRAWQKYQLKMVASKIMKAIFEELQLPCAAAYSGGKGVHVYAFTGMISAAEAREGAQIVLDSIGNFHASRGTNFYKWDDEDPVTGYPNLSVEVFPKQDSLSGKDLGNLMRLPLGRNLKSTDPTFFIDMRSPMSQMVPVDTAWALNTTNPWGDS